MSDTPFLNSVYVDDEPGFGNIVDNESPAILEQQPEGMICDVPDYLVPSATLHWNPRAIEGNSKRAQYIRTARSLGASGLTLDRQQLRETLLQPMSSADYLTAFGLYTSLLRTPDSSSLKRHAENASGAVIYAKVRSDLKALLVKGEELFTAMPEDEGLDFIKAMAANFSVKRTDDGNSNPSIYLARNGLFDIVSNPDSVLAPDTVMGTRLLRVFADKHSASHGIIDFYDSFVKDPRGLINNPELLFLLDESFLGEKISRRDVMNLSGGVVAQLFRKVQDAAPEGSYAANLGLAYFKIADKAMEDSGLINRRKPSDGNTRFTPGPLISLAKLVAKSNPGDLANLVPDASGREFSKAFDYLLPMLELDNLWPDLDSETVVAIEKALSTVIHLTDSLFV